MENIVEVIDGKGVQSTTGESEVYKRLQTPKPGDPVIFESNEYPFNSDFGRIEGVNAFCEEGEVHIVCKDGSVYLNNSGAVSISGGSFECVKLAKLEPMLELKAVRFWNWGDNSPGANQGVHYIIERPVFKLMK